MLSCLNISWCRRRGRGEREGGGWGWFGARGNATLGFRKGRVLWGARTWLPLLGGDGETRRLEHRTRNGNRRRGGMKKAGAMYETREQSCEDAQDRTGNKTRALLLCMEGRDVVCERATYNLHIVVSMPLRFACLPPAVWQRLEIRKADGAGGKGRRAQSLWRGLVDGIVSFPRHSLGRFRAPLLCIAFTHTHIPLDGPSSSSLCPSRALISNQQYQPTLDTQTQIQSLAFNESLPSR